MESSSFFEGPEKKLEVVVTPGFPALRSFGEGAWVGIVEAAGARVLSTLRSERCDAYLLSESSLFVFDDRFVLITCGRTTLVEALPQILEVIPRAAIAFLVYERKSEHFPEHQPTTFREDALRLQRTFGGRTLRFGNEQGRCVEMFHTIAPSAPGRRRPTLEVLMHEIDVEVADHFASGRVPRDTSLVASLGIDAVFPGFTTSEHVFKPAGYSLNALKGEEYYTVHVTPEETGSYASFETNHRLGDHLASLVGSIVEIFRPRGFDVITFVTQVEPDLPVRGYRLAEHVVHDIGSHRVGYFQYLARPREPRTAREVEL
ncbi:MAG: hypothetical protein WBM46_01625 [Polyangiales bacterium]|jgi:S-adenosylmethionine decarboxylase